MNLFNLSACFIVICMLQCIVSSAAAHLEHQSFQQPLDLLKQTLNKEELHLKKASSLSIKFNEKGSKEYASVNYMKIRGNSRTLNEDVFAKNDIYVSFDIESDDGESKVMEFYMKETAPIFSKDINIELLKGKNQPIKMDLNEIKSKTRTFVTSSKSLEENVNNEWAMFDVIVDENNLSNHKINGMFTINNNSKLMKITFVEDENIKLNEDSPSRSHVFYDIEHQNIRNLGSNEELKCGIDDKNENKKSENKYTTNNKSNYKSDSKEFITNNEPLENDLSKYIKFYPGCFTNDHQPHQFDIGIAVDYGYFKAMDMDIHKLSKDIEQIVSNARGIYMLQLNILPVIQNLVIATSTLEDFPLNMSPSDDTCAPDIVYALQEFGYWNSMKNDNRPDRERGHWHLFTDCWKLGNRVGFAEMNSLCEARRNVGITSRALHSSTWLIFAHEMGHAFGATHSIGVGGLMDYGNPYYKDVIQFDIGKKSEICKEIKSIAGTCRHLYLINEKSICGNGIIEKDETCECLSIGSRSCGKCINCLLSDREVQCSANDFQMRTPNDKNSESINVDINNMADKECCSPEGKMQLPNVTCNGGKDVCISGKCTAICGLYNFQSCKSINQGCSQPCLYQNKCSSRLITFGGVKVSWIPDGTKCDENSECESGECKSLPPTTSAPTTSKPTNTPTLKPTTSMPTAKPTTLYPTTNTPTNIPTTSKPTKNPMTRKPTSFPTLKPGFTPSDMPNDSSFAPTAQPSNRNPTTNPIKLITSTPTRRPGTFRPSRQPTKPTTLPTTKKPTLKPRPSSSPTQPPSNSPTSNPTIAPSLNPTRRPTKWPTSKPTKNPTKFPTEFTLAPTKKPRRLN